MNTTLLESITINEMQVSPVWRFCEQRGNDEAHLAPVKRIPCSDLSGRIVATQVELANGSQVWAFLGNIDPTNPRLSEHVVTISVHNDGKWFHLARYHDFDYHDRGPRQLADFLGLKEGEVFPIRYDVKKFVATADREALAGTIDREPRTRLSRAQIIALAVP